MNKRLIAVVVLALSSTLLAQTTAAPKKPAAQSAATQSKAPVGQATKPWEKIPIPPLPPFHPQEPKKIELKNGMTIFLQEDHELPFIGASATVRGGARAEPAAKTGLIDIYGDVWRTGGTTSKTGDQMDDFLEARAARIETGGGAASTSISFSCLKNNLDEVFPLFIELLRQPAFREDKIELAKLQMNSGIARRNDDVGSIAGREAAKIVYGKDNPLARVPEYSTVAAITRQDLVQWHDAHTHPNNILLSVSGDFDSAKMEQRLRQAFESWERGPAVEPPKIDFRNPDPKVYFVAKEDVNQSDIRLMKLGIQRNDPDYFAVEVMNEVLGGGFSSRLFKTIRTEKGLAYSVGGGIGAAFDHPGVFSVSMATKSSSTVDAIEALKTELGNMITKPVTADELKEAKDSILNRFIFNFDSKSKVLAERVVYDFYGYPADFLEKYRAGIDKTTVDDVNRVARKYIHPDQLAILVVGNDKEFVKPLATLGQVTTLDITIPEPGASPQSAGGGQATKPAQSDPQAKAILDRVIGFLGGANVVSGVKAVHQVSTGEQVTPQGMVTIDNDSYTVFPDHFYSVAKSAALPGVLHIIVGPEGSWISIEGQGSQAMPPSMKQERINSIRRAPLAIAQRANELTVTMGDQSPEAQVIHISGPGVDVQWAVDGIDPAAGKLLRSTFTTTGPQGPVQRTVEYSDWRAVSGVNIPFKATVLEGGKQVGSDTLKSAEINPKIDPKMFEKPSESAPQ